MHYNLMAEEWGDHPWQVGQMSAVGNVAARRPVDAAASSRSSRSAATATSSTTASDNIAVDQIGEPLPMFGRYTTTPAKIIEMTEPPLWPAGLTPMPAARGADSTCCTTPARVPGTATMTTCG